MVEATGFDLGICVRPFHFDEYQTKTIVTRFYSAFHSSAGKWIFSFETRGNNKVMLGMSTATRRQKTESQRHEDDLRTIENYRPIDDDIMRELFRSDLPL